MATRLYVGGLAYETTQESLEKLFAGVCETVSVSLVIDRATNTSRGFAFVEVPTPEDATKAIETLNNYSFEGRKLTVNEARPREDKPAGGGYNGGGNRGGGYGGGRN